MLNKEEPRDRRTDWLGFSKEEIFKAVSERWYMVPMEEGEIRTRPLSKLTQDIVQQLEETDLLGRYC